MASFEHEGLIDLFRMQVEFAPYILREVLRVAVPEHSQTGWSDASHTVLMPTVMQSDLVLDLRDAENELVACIIVEVQRSIDPDKRRSWPSYIVNAYSKRGCAVELLVVTPSRTVANWARQPITIGSNRMVVQVLGPDEIPRLTEPVTHPQALPLAILSAMVYGNQPDGTAVLEVASSAMVELPTDQASNAYLLIWEALEGNAQDAFKELVMKRYVDNPKGYPFPFQVVFDRGLDQGREKGREEGRQVGQVEGEILQSRRILERMFERRGWLLGAAEVARMESCRDPAQWEAWVLKALEAQSSAEVWQD